MEKAYYQQFKDFELFSRALIESKDVDPTYGFIRKLLDELGYKTRQERQWFVLVYTTFYSLKSAIQLTQYLPWGYFNDKEFRELRLSKAVNSFGIERRGNVRAVDNQIKMFRRIIPKIEKDDFDYRSNPHFRQNIMTTIPMHGAWSSYKIAEVFEKSLGYEALTISDLGIDNKDINSNDGPIGGLKWLYGREYNVDFDESFKGVWNRFGVNLAEAWGVDIGEVESVLCKWHKIKTGNYYIGYDIHEFTELNEDPLPKPMYARVMSIFNPQLWVKQHGVNKVHKKAYVNTGLILNAAFAKKLPEIDVLEILLKTE